MSIRLQCPSLGKERFVEISEFRSLLEKGLGRAIVYLQTHDAAPFREVILHACTHDLRFDRQLEPSRGRYLFDLVQHTQEPEYYRERILASLQQPGEGE